MHFVDITRHENVERLYIYERQDSSSVLFLTTAHIKNGVIISRHELSLSQRGQETHV